jgi:DNA-binding CsgD family transcriptional regulator
LATLDADAANIAAALEWAAQTDAELALRICAAATIWWRARGRFIAAEAGCARALDAADETPSALRARVLWGRGYLRIYAGDYETGCGLAQQALAMAEEVGDDSSAARALCALATVTLLPDPVAARPLAERSRELASAAGDRFCLVDAMQIIAYSHVVRFEGADTETLLEDLMELTESLGYREFEAWQWIGLGQERLYRAELATARQFFDRAIAIAEEIGEPVTAGFGTAYIGELDLVTGHAERTIAAMTACREQMLAAGTTIAISSIETTRALALAATGDLDGARLDYEAVAERFGDGIAHILCLCLMRLADLLRLQGEPEAAGERLQAAIETAERVESRFLTALARHGLGRIAASRGDWSEAESLLHELLAESSRVGYRLYMPDSIEGLAEVAAGLESHEEAARLLAAAASARAELGLARWLPEHEHWAALEERLREALSEEAFEAAWSEGSALDLKEAVAYVSRARGSRKRPSGGWESLTPTELEVVRHAAGGLTNPQIGERMFISRGTVKVHLSHIFQKLDVATRSELAAEAARRELLSADHVEA